VVAWSRWITGERQDLTDGFYESVCVIPNACDTGDEVWVAVRRRIAIVEPAAALSIALGADTVGATITFTTDAAVFTAEDVGRTITDLVTGTGVALITTVTSATEVDATIIEAFDAAVASLAATDWDLSTLRRVIELFDYGMQVDSGVRYAGSAADAVSGLDHLVGATVTTLADGVDGAALVDADGMVTLAAAATEIQAGVGYLSRVRTLRPEANLPGGLSAGRTRRMVDALVRFFCCGPGWTVNDKDVGLTGDEDELIQDKRVVNLGWDRLGRITIEQARPYPGTVLAIGGRMEVEDDG
jgi:hypothetical protein